MWRLYHAIPSLTIVLVAILIKVLNEGTTGGEWVVVLFQNLTQILVNEVVNRNMSRIPSAAVKTAEEEVLGSIGTRTGRDIRCTTSVHRIKATIRTYK